MDALDLPQPTKCQIDRYIGAGLANNLQWRTWAKPRGASMVHILCLGSGAGGGGGFTRAAGNAGGGGGGGSGAQTSLIIPAHFLPDTLYVQAGGGSLGVSTGTAGSGVVSYVAVAPSGNSAAVVTQNIVCASGGSLPAGGVSGTLGAGGTPGSAGGVASLAGMPFGALGAVNFIAGNVGTAGGTPTNGAGSTQSLPTTGICTMGGFGGGGSSTLDQIGGSVGGLADSLLSDIRPRPSAAGSFDGSGGFTLWKPFFNFSGVGGSSSAAGVGGNGGNGAFGAGGGGGGSGTTGGRGGDGGPGLVIITSW